MIYSFWVKREYKEIHTPFGISYPIYLKGGQYITIGTNFYSGKRLRLECWDSYRGIMYNPKITIMDNVNIGHDCHIGAINYIYVGNNVLIGSKVYISDHSHGDTTLDDLKLPPIDRTLHSKGGVVIKDNVWIGEGVTILPAVTIGENSIIGANSVVTKSFPANCVIGGNPAKVIKEIINKKHE